MKFAVFVCVKYVIEISRKFQSCLKKISKLSTIIQILHETKITLEIILTKVKLANQEQII